MTESNDSIINLIPPGKLRCVVTGKLRNDKPEENVRQRMARSLIYDYGYRPENLAIEFPIKIGSSRRRVDIAIFPPDTKHVQENIIIIVECKNEDTKPTDRDNGIDQLKSHISACLNCRFGMWIGSELQVWERIRGEDGRDELLPSTDVPRFAANQPTRLQFSDLVPAHEELNATFKRCHNYIYGNQGIQKEPAFQELLKIIFCKVFDEDSYTGNLKFYIGNRERRSELGRLRFRTAMDELFTSVKSQYTYIFSHDERIELNDSVLAYIGGELQRYSLMNTQADVKGVAYEELVGSNLRGDRGEFFTPRSICDMAARMLLATFPYEQRLDVRVLAGC